MPTTLVQPTEMNIGSNHQEFLKQAQMSLKPHLKLPIAFGTADTAVLFTVPALTNGAKALQIDSAMWEVTTSFTGGSSSAIGIASSNANYNTAGDILGGATGDVAAGLLSTGLTYKGGTIGAKYGSNGKVCLVAGDTIVFNRITSAFTAGAGFVHLNVSYVD